MQEVVEVGVETKKQIPLLVKTSAIGVLFITLFAHFVNDTYSMLTPSLLPLLKKKFALNYLQLGILTSIPFAISAFLQSISGHIGEKYAKRRLLLISGFLILGFGYTIFSQAPTYHLMLVAAILIGLGLSTYHPQGIAVLTGSYPAEMRGRVLGIHGIGGSMGFLTGPFLGGVILSLWGLKGFKWIWIPGLLMAFVIWKFLKIKEKPVEKSYMSAFNFTLLAVAFLASINTFFSRGITSFMPSYFYAKGEGIFKSNLFTTYMLLPGLIAQPIGGAISDYLGRKRVIAFGYMMSALLLILFLKYPHIYILIAMGFFVFLTIPVRYAFVIDVAGEKAGTGVGVMLTFSLMLASLAPTLIGFLIDNFGFENAFRVIAFIGAGAGLVVLTLKEGGKK